MGYDLSSYSTSTIVFKTFKTFHFRTQCEGVTRVSRLQWLATLLFRLGVLVHSPHVESVNGGVAGCLRFVLHNISGCIDYTTVSYTACNAASKVISNIISNIITNSNVCDATLRMDDTVSEKSQSSETSRTPVNPEVSQSSLSTVEKQSSDASRFEIPMGRRRKDLLPIEKSVDAALLKPHLLGVSRQTHCSIPFVKQIYFVNTTRGPIERVQSDTVSISGSVPETDVGQLLGSHSISLKHFMTIYTGITWYKAV